MTQYQTEIGKRVDAFDGQSLTTTLWALAALSVRQRGAGRSVGMACCCCWIRHDVTCTCVTRGLAHMQPSPPLDVQATHCDAFKRLVDRFVELEPDGNFQVGGQRPLMAERMDRRGACTALALLHATWPTPRSPSCALLGGFDNSVFSVVCAPPSLSMPAQDVQYNQVLQAVLLAQFEMQRRPGEFREEINLPDRIVDRALAAWKQQQQVWRRQRGLQMAGRAASFVCRTVCLRLFPLVRFCCLPVTLLPPALAPLAHRHHASPHPARPPAGRQAVCLPPGGQRRAGAAGGGIRGGVQDGAEPAERGHCHHHWR